ncbi:MAG: ImmA/IrrE family metallo-endopeptidase [Deltaproteobacteria bacterium]|jgi:Zn-dependent peptidase ImmA (M78 family)/transcriptional regulator with XRE-family HTH domain|nr:ImmA/IrrE family metallo-endopeptidase [Deltaproteobacteria bacterium]
MEPNQQFIQNLIRSRKAKGLSQKNLADALGCALSFIQRIERGKTVPDMEVIFAIAKALDVMSYELFQEIRELRSVRFRSYKKINPALRETILAHAAVDLDSFLFLEDLLEDKIQFRLANIIKRGHFQSPAEAARQCRKELGLNLTEPIYDICGLMEKSGVKVIPLSIPSDDFFALSIGPTDGGPAVVLNVWEKITLERQIFSLAHELGHLVLHPDDYVQGLPEGTKDDKKQEKEANSFAGHFLMPNDGFFQEWKKYHGMSFVNNVLKVKCVFHVSYQTVLYRLYENSKFKNFSAFRVRFMTDFETIYGYKLGHKDDPPCHSPEYCNVQTPEPFESPRINFFDGRFKLLLRKALSQGKISISRAAEILRFSMEKMRDLVFSWRY